MPNVQKQLLLCGTKFTVLLNVINNFCYDPFSFSVPSVFVLETAENLLVRRMHFLN